MNAHDSLDRATLRTLGAAALYGIVIVGVNLIDNAFKLPSWSRVLVALLPVIPAIMLLVMLLARVRALDEVQQRIVTESALAAAGAVGLASFAWGLIEEAVSLPEVSLIWVLPAMIAVFGITKPYVRRRYN